MFTLYTSQSHSYFLVVYDLDSNLITFSNYTRWMYLIYVNKMFFFGSMSLPEVVQRPPTSRNHWNDIIITVFFSFPHIPAHVANPKLSTSNSKLHLEPSTNVKCVCRNHSKSAKRTDLQGCRIDSREHFQRKSM